MLDSHWSLPFPTPCLVVSDSSIVIFPLTNPPNRPLAQAIASPFTQCLGTVHREIHELADTRNTSSQEAMPMHEYDRFPTLDSSKLRRLSGWGNR